MSLQNPTSSPRQTRRIVTGHTSSGKAIYLSDDVFVDGQIVSQIKGADNGEHAEFNRLRSFITTNLFMTTAHSPLPSNHSGSSFVDIAKEEPEKAKVLLSENGSMVRIVDIPPKAESPFHRSLSLDYAIVIYGSVICELDDTVRRTISAGDVLVQRGTIHKWINESESEWARMFVVMLAANPVVVDDNKELGTEFHA